MTLVVKSNMDSESLKRWVKESDLATIRKRSKRTKSVEYKGG
jgi:hypothetical protein